MAETTCALCHERRPRLRSHLMPHALYRMCRKPTVANPNPVALGGHRPKITSQQAVLHLLCSECEQLLSRRGEKYVVGGCSRPDGTFPIRENLLKLEPHGQSGGQPYYCGTQVPRIDSDALRFFATSVFWR